MKLHHIIQAITLPLLLVACSGAYPIESEQDMAHGDDDMILTEDPFEFRARGQDSPNPSIIVEPIAPRRGPWSGNNQLGTTQPFSPDANNRQTILKLDEWGMPEVWTVMLGLDLDLDGLAPGSFLDVKAVVSVGTGGTTQEFEVDWKNGVTFSAPMNAINIMARYDNAANIDDSNLRLTATLGRGDFSGLPPTFTPPSSVTLLAGATSALIEIPAFASELVIGNISLAYDPLVFYDILDLNGASAFQRYSGADMLALGGKVAMHNRSRFIQVRNTSASAVQMYPYFLLDL